MFEIVLLLEVDALVRPDSGRTWMFTGFRAQAQAALPFTLASHLILWSPDVALTR